MAVKLSERAPKAEEAEVSNCVSNLIQAFTNGLNVFKRLRERKRKRKARKENQQPDAATSDEVQLSKSLRRGPQELAQQYDALYSQTGQKFAKGDAVAHASLAETLIKLNTGLVAIIASFLGHDQKGGKGQIKLDYKSLTNLSDVSRKEALQSMTQLYQRISQSQLNLYQMNASSCARCGSSHHYDCSTRSNSSTPNPDKDRKKHSSSRQRAPGPTIARMPIKSSSQPQLVVVRPKHTRKGSSGSVSSHSKSASSSSYTSPLASPLPLYIAEEPFEIKTDGVIHGVLGGPMPLASHGRRRKDSFNVYDPRPSTWPDPHPYTVMQPRPESFHLHMPAPKLPSFTSTPRRPAPPQQKASPAPPPVSAPIRRRMDKVTPSSYTFASDSTKLGEIPQRNWTMPWDYEEAERLNAEAAVIGYPGLPVVVDDKKKKKGLFRWMRRGSGAGVAG